MPKGWQRSDDVAWTTSGDRDGFHVLAAEARRGYQWRTVASLSEPGLETDQWIGNACVTGSGRRLVVVYAPRTFTNRPHLFDRGAFTAVVDLTSGKVTKVPVMGSLAYFNPGCGVGETAIVSQYRGDGGSAQTRLVEVDTQRGTAAESLVVKSEVTSAIPVAGGIAAAAGSRVVRIGRDGRAVRLARATGVPFRLAPDADGGVVFMDRAGDRVRIQRSTGRPGTAPVTLAGGGLHDIGLTPGPRGRVHLLGTPATTAGKLPAGVARLKAPVGATVSTRGDLAISRVSWQGAAPVAALDHPADRAVEITAVVPATNREVRFAVPPSLPEGHSPSGGIQHPKLGAAGGRARPARSLGSPTDPSEAERTCSVPRNDVRNQVLQPKPRQVEWAVDQAVTDSLHLTRENNWMNSGIGGYSPQGLFPSVPLEGGGRVPAQIVLGIIAQESNLWHASPLVLPGQTGNPLIGNFYGRNLYNEDPADDWDIDWSDADCGYGVMQVTDGMRAAGKEKPGETAMAYYTQRVVALDYAVNIAAGLTILQNKWNETRRAGLTIGTGNPESLENWFYAIWAYNTGFYPKTREGAPWGVGWSNNPANPKYDLQRTPFLEFGYHDARFPQRWPYPEKVLGWAGHPVEAYEGPDTPVPGFRPAWWTSVKHREMVKPPLNLFCDASNSCVPGGEFVPNVPDDPSTPHDEGTIGEPAGPCAHKNAAGQYDLKCWAHEHKAWKMCPDQCGNELLRFDPGYAYQTDGTSYPPVCSLQGLPTGSLVIDNLPDDVPSMREASPGTKCRRQHANAGSFALDFAAGTGGSYTSKIDFHQIGGGFNGHFWLASTRNPEIEGDRFRVTGTWRLSRPLNGWARVLVHVPDHAVHTQQASYEITTGYGVKRRVIPQRLKKNRWISLGAMRFTGNPSVRLSTDTYDGIGEEGVAWDAIAFQPLPSKPRHIIAALGDSYSSGEGAGAYSPESDTNGDNMFRNPCHRSENAWSRRGVLGDSSETIGVRADRFDPTLDYRMVACSGARTHNILPITTVASGEPPPSVTIDGRTLGGRGQYRELSQLDQGFVDRDTTLVTLSIGGNDARFADILQECIILAGFKDCPTARLEGDKESVATATLRRISGDVKNAVVVVLLEIKKRAPNAQVILMGYPRLLENDGSCIPGIGAGEASWLNSTGDVLAYYMGKSVELARAQGVDAYFSDPRGRFAGKAVCGIPEETVHAIVTGKTPGEPPGALVSAQSFHPKNSGTVLYASTMNDTLRLMGL